VDILEVIHNDHQAILQIINALLDERLVLPRQRRAAFNDIKNELTPHMEAEEVHYYQFLLDTTLERETVLYALEQHEMMRKMMVFSESLSVQDERWLPRVKLFSKLIQDHIEHEEGPLFKESRRIMDAELRAVLAQEFEKLKESFKEKV